VLSLLIVVTEDAYAVFPAISMHLFLRMASNETLFLVDVSV